MKNKRNKGITLISLIITIIIMLILAGITLYGSKNLINEAKIEEVKTNMLLIEAKAREYVEEVNFKMGPQKDATKKAEAIQEVYITKVGLVAANDASLAISVPTDSGIDLSKCYAVTETALNNMGLNKIELQDGEYYLIKFNEEEAAVEEIYNTLGYKGNYSLTQFESIEE